MYVRRSIAATRAHNFTEETMERKQVSDINKTMMATRIFNDILNNIQSSKLNFCLQLSPYSANISLKKTFLTDRSGNVLLPDYAYTAEPSSDDNIAALVSKNLKLEEENSALRKICREIRNQLLFPKNDV